METAVSMTHAARNLADLVNRVYYRSETITLMKNGKEVARIVPPTVKPKTGKELAAAIAKFPRLSAEDAKDFAEDLRQARAELKMPEPWD